MAHSSEFSVEKITFDQIKKYWIEVDHFADPDKIYVEFPKVLGHLTTEIMNPRGQCYGLFSDSRLIGVTQLIEWAPGTVRYRTINIRSEFRGNDLGYYLLKLALKKDWADFSRLFGWVRKSHYGWSVKHGFQELDGKWTDDHIAMFKNISNVNEL